MKRFYIVLITLATVFFQPAQAHACRFVADTRPLTERIGDYETVFIGKVITAESEEGTGNEDALITVLATVKGEPRHGDEVKVTSHAGSCSVRFSKGSIWLIASSAEKPYAVHMATATTLIVDDRGIPANGWGSVKKILSDEAITQLSQTETCVQPSLALDDFFEGLPKQCRDSADCNGFYINPFPCSSAIIARKDALTPQIESKLLALQKTTREACLSQLDHSKIPACSPEPYTATCLSGICVDQRYVPQ